MEKTVGVLGGGQLGRMLTEAAHNLMVKVITLDAEAAPAKQVNAHPAHVVGSFKEPDAIRALAEKCDVLTVEIEHVNTHVLEELDGKGKGKVEVQPSWRTLRVIQDKYMQKEHLIDNKISTAQAIAVSSATSQTLEQVAHIIGYPFMLKSRTEAYDGRGNYPVKSASDIKDALNTLAGRPLYAERWADFKAELAVMVVKTQNDASSHLWQRATIAYPVAETVHEDSVCKLVYAPARNIPETVMQQAEELARRAVATFWGKGVFGVEMFFLSDDTLLINEIAPRPHNSGHYTIEACPVSQYEAHLFAILDIPIPKSGTRFKIPSTNAIMLNILGGAQANSHVEAFKMACSLNGRSIHMYGKGDGRPGRKMGHVTVIADTLVKAEEDIQPLVGVVDKIRAEWKPRARVYSDKISVPWSDRSLAKPLVAVTMGSDSDLPVLMPGIDLLKELGIPHYVTITSAHRTPRRMFKFAEEAESNGFKVIIAAAGGAAHLPGMIASSTLLPVVGVPVKGKALDGLDSVLSILQMPRGVPVATVAIDNSVNATLIAARILATTNPRIRERLADYVAKQTETVLEKAEKMEKAGAEDYH